MVRVVVSVLLVFHLGTTLLAKAEAAKARSERDAFIVRMEKGLSWKRECFCEPLIANQVLANGRRKRNEGLK